MQARLNSEEIKLIALAIGLAGGIMLSIHKKVNPVK